MNVYESFAIVYDLFMDNVDYDGWSVYLIKLLRSYGIEDGLILELGCGTGNMTERLAAAGFDMIGVDYSGEMLKIAQKKHCASSLDILYMKQDMRTFELCGTVRAVVSVCDSLNYILKDEELVKVFRLVNHYLDPGGIFLFDLNTIDKYKKIGNTTIAENREESSFIWDNYYDKDENINEYQLTIFLKEEDGDLYRKCEEVHYQRGYELKQIKEFLKEAGMEFLNAFEAFTEDVPNEDSERIYIIARERGKV
ncbi:MAG: methyltransferase domain-containing protein [Lachnospiraceae bacterium]|nr:methyltransferase domain-containing protein [Lachnospiraceae bacterium]